MWVWLSLASAVCQVLRNAVMKRLGHALDEYVNVWGRFTFQVPFALVLCLLHGWPTLKPGFLGWCVAFGISQTAATLALSKGLTRSALSLVTPLWKVSLLVLLAMEYAAGEHPTALGISGVLLGAAGVYLLNVSRARVSVWEPLRALVADRGQRYTLLAACLYAPAVLTYKQVILASDPATGMLAAYSTASLVMTPLVVTASARQLRAVPGHLGAFSALGFFAMLTSLTHGIAYTLTLATYVETVKQADILVAMLVGIVMFGEGERVRASAPGALLILLGMVFLALAG